MKLKQTKQLKWKVEKRTATHPTMTEGLHRYEHILWVQIAKIGNIYKQLMPPQNVKR